MPEVVGIAVVILYADDAKLLNEIEDHDGISINVLQSDLERLVEWAANAEMHFNPGECKVKHVGRRIHPCRSL